MSRKINEIAKEIREDWKPVSLYADPYLDAMEQLESVDGNFYCDSAASVIRYFLGNAKTWRGDVARRVKQELNHMIAGKY